MPHAEKCLHKISYIYAMGSFPSGIRKSEISSTFVSCKNDPTPSRSSLCLAKRALPKISLA